MWLMHFLTNCLFEHTQMQLRSKPDAGLPALREEVVTNPYPETRSYLQSITALKEKEDFFQWILTGYANRSWRQVPYPEVDDKHKMSSLTFKSVFCLFVFFSYFFVRIFIFIHYKFWLYIIAIKFCIFIVFLYVQMYTSVSKCFYFASGLDLIIIIIICLLILSILISLFWFYLICFFLLF